MNANSKPQAQTVNSWLRTAVRILDENGIATADLDAELILAHSLGVNRTWLHAHHDEAVNASEADALLEKRAQRMPLAYITGIKEFHGREFIVTPDVLIPRPETETLIELAKQYHLQGKVLDVGCGSGAIGLTLALEMPVQITLSDISTATLEVARENAKLLDVTDVQFVTSDLLAQWVTRKKPEQFDGIVANLPYVSSDWERSPETEHEPALALFADDNGLALIKKLITQVPKVLKKGGYLLLEADPEQHPVIIQLAVINGLLLHTVQDYIVALKRV